MGGLHGDRVREAGGEHALRDRADNMAVHLDDVAVIHEQTTRPSSKALTLLVKVPQGVVIAARYNPTGVVQELTEVLRGGSVRVQDFHGAGLREGDCLSHDVLLGGSGGEELFRPHKTSMADAGPKRKS
jgi:hypothetical protein